MSAGTGGGGRHREPGLWQQFRRRRVTRTVLLYLVISYLVAEAALFLSPVLGITEVGLRVVLGAIVLGFPVAVVLAWTYDVTPTGIVKTPEDLAAEPPPSPGPERGWVMLGGVALVTALILRLLRG